MARTKQASTEIKVRFDQIKAQNPARTLVDIAAQMEREGWETERGYPITYKRLAAILSNIRTSARRAKKAHKAAKAKTAVDAVPEGYVQAREERVGTVVDTKAVLSDVLASSLSDKHKLYLVGWLTQ